MKRSSKYFPYTEVNFNVAGLDKEAYYRNQSRINELKHKHENKRAELVQKESEMHDFIYLIKDSRVRQIFILRFMDGLTQDQIAKKVHLDQSVVSREIKKYLGS